MWYRDKLLIRLHNYTEYHIVPDKLEKKLFTQIFYLFLYFYSFKTGGRCGTEKAIIGLKAAPALAVP